MKGFSLGFVTGLMTFSIGIVTSSIRQSHMYVMTPCEQGMIEARRNIRNGRLGSKYCGKKGEVTHAYRTMENLEKAYGIRNEWVGDCSGEGEPGMKAYCYNVIMTQEFVNRYGTGTNERFSRMAQQELGESEQK